MKRCASVAGFIMALGLTLAFAQSGQPGNRTWSSGPVVSMAQAAPSGAPTQDVPKTAAPTEGQQQPEGQQDSSANSATQPGVRTFMGSVVQVKGVYVLRAGDVDFKLDDQAKAREFAGKNVKIEGSLDKQSSVLRVRSIEASPSM